MSLVPPYINQEWIFDLDQQLSHAGYRAVHVTTGLRLVGLSWGATGVLKLEHLELDSFLQAEMIAQRVNCLRGVCDQERMQLLELL